MLLRWRCGAPRTLAAVVTLALGTTALAGCGGSPAAASAPVLRVAATNFAMAELVHGVGGSRVAVTELAKGAPDDRTVDPSPTQVDELRSAQLVVEVGGGWQPQVEAIAGTGPRVLALGHQATATGSQVWLDPLTMEAAAQELAAKLIALDPAGASTYRNGVRDFDDNLSSVSVDYQSSLGDCEYNTVFTPDSAFAAVANQYGFKLHSVPAGGGAVALRSAAAAAATQSFHGLFSEPPLSSPQMGALAARAKSSVGELDTMDGPPIKAEPATSTYVDRLEANLTYLTGALYCQDNDEP
jgi:ABC-type Zn uptake system ZnuABC Zn-binding protein ZnuA